MLPSQRKIYPAQAYEVTLANDSGIRPKLSYGMMRRHAGGRESLGFLPQDYKNMLHTKMTNDLKHGEVGNLLNYFNNKLLENPSFIFTIQTDIEDEITNIFWADARMLLDYNYFGDVVSLDTTYRTNKDSRPFGAFIGLNNHFQQVMFGACLMYDETADSFQWLFDASQKLPQLKLNIPLLRHARDVYTEKLFEIFQEEFEKSLLVVTEHKECTNNLCDFKVSVYGYSKLYEISINYEDGKINCSCKKFEFCGIPCNHILKVLDEMKIKSMIPEVLILKMDKNARSEYIISECGNEAQEDPKLEINIRYRSLCSTYVKLAGKPVESKEAHQFLQENAKQVAIKVDEFFSVQYQSEAHKSSIIDGNTYDPVNNLAMDILKQSGTTHVAKLKAKPTKTRRKTRLKSFLEKSSKKKHSNVEPRLYDIHVLCLTV